MSLTRSDIVIWEADQVVENGMIVISIQCKETVQCVKENLLIDLETYSQCKVIYVKHGLKNQQYNRVR